jgi:hypothetical protein
MTGMAFLNDPTGICPVVRAPFHVRGETRVGELYEHVKLTKKFNYLNALVRLLGTENLEKLNFTPLLTLSS